MISFLRLLRYYLLQMAILLVMVGCSLDFDEAIPCENDEHCPEDYYCDPIDLRCLSGPGLEESEDQDDQENQNTQEDQNDQQDDQSSSE